jgi:hypothetical protein
MQLRFEAHDRGRTEVVGWIFSWKPEGVICWSSRRTRLHISVRFGIHCAASQGRPDSRGGLLFLVSHQNLNPSYWCIWRTQNPQKRIRIKKVRGPQSKGDQELKKNKSPNITKPKLDHEKNSLYVSLVLLKFQDDL